MNGPEDLPLHAVSDPHIGMQEIPAISQNF